MDRATRAIYCSLQELYESHLSTITFNKSNVYRNENAEWYLRRHRIRTRVPAGCTRDAVSAPGSALRTGLKEKNQEGTLPKPYATQEIGGRGGATQPACCRVHSQGHPLGRVRAPARRTQEQGPHYRKNEKTDFTLCRGEIVRGDERRDGKPGSGTASQMPRLESEARALVDSLTSGVACEPARSGVYGQGGTNKIDVSGKGEGAKA